MNEEISPDLKAPLPDKSIASIDSKPSKRINFNHLVFDLEEIEPEVAITSKTSLDSKKTERKVRRKGKGR